MNKRDSKETIKKRMHSFELDKGAQDSRVSNMKTVFSDESQEVLFKLEEDSWWFQYRARVITGFMNSFFKKNVLTTDVGGGNGYTTVVASNLGYAMQLLEPSQKACDNAVKRGLRVTCGMMTEDYPEDGSFRQILLLDVLEHIEDDEGFLKLLNTKTVDGGVLLITVPALMCLWSSEDDFAGHYRRYSIGKLKKCVEAAGFHVEYSSYFFWFLFLPILLVRVGMERIGILKPQDKRTEKERKVVRDKQFKTAGVVNHILTFVERIEYSLLMKRKNRILLGSSLIIVCKK